MREPRSKGSTNGEYAACKYHDRQTNEAFGSTAAARPVPVQCRIGPAAPGPDFRLPARRVAAKYRVFANFCAKNIKISNLASFNP
jgi:hypothetical protein